jgi:gamma-glutamylcyclotransferase (GGCT)/AIG2-like uncharacterized protein YtfP
MLYFAYGSNMSRDAMRTRCPGARALGTATLAGWRFFINGDGYASIARAAGHAVEGVLWSVTARDVAALDAYENVAGGLYRRTRLAVRQGERSAQSALVYLGRTQRKGLPRHGYMDGVIAAARDWRFSARALRALERHA